MHKSVVLNKSNFWTMCYYYALYAFRMNLHPVIAWISINLAGLTKWL